MMSLGSEGRRDEIGGLPSAGGDYPEAGARTLGALSYAALGLGGEAGEFQNKLKKVIRDHGGRVTPEFREQMAAELGDVLWYVARCSSELGLDLERIATENLAKLQERKAEGTLVGSGDRR